MRDAKRKKDGFVVGMQMHSEAPKRARTDTDQPTSRQVRSGALESVLRPDTGGTGDRDAQPPVEHSCWRAWAWRVAVSEMGAAALPQGRQVGSE
jgi:hypothetical protein